MRFLKALLIAVFFFAAFVFFIQNNAVLTTPFALSFDTYMGPAWTPEAVPFYIIVLLAFLAGCVLMWALLALGNLSLRLQKRKAQKAAKKFEAELKALRAIPLPEAEKSGQTPE